MKKNIRQKKNLQHPEVMAMLTILLQKRRLCQWSLTKHKKVIILYWKSGLKLSYQNYKNMGTSLELLVSRPCLLSEVLQMHWKKESLRKLEVKSGLTFLVMSLELVTFYMKSVCKEFDNVKKILKKRLGLRKTSKS